MAALATTLANALLNATLRNTAYVQPTTVYVALFTVTPTAAGGGTEATGGSYARVAVTFGAAAAGQVTNSADALFPAATVGWGTIVAAAIFDSLNGGTLLYFGPCGPIAINTGDQPKFVAGTLAVSLA